MVWSAYAAVDVWDRVALQHGGLTPVRWFPVHSSSGLGSLPQVCLEQSQCFKMSPWEMRGTASSEACEMTCSRCTCGLPSASLLEDVSGGASVTLSCVTAPTVFATSSSFVSGSFRLCSWSGGAGNETEDSVNSSEKAFLHNRERLVVRLQSLHALVRLFARHDSQCASVFLVGVMRTLIEHISNSKRLRCTRHKK